MRSNGTHGVATTAAVTSAAPRSIHRNQRSTNRTGSRRRNSSATAMTTIPAGTHQRWKVIVCDTVIATITTTVSNVPRRARDGSSRMLK
jgi:hypothetical protein